MRSSFGAATRSHRAAKRCLEPLRDRIHDHIPNSSVYSRFPIPDSRFPLSILFFSIKLVVTE
ncbi:hypothetical protein [Moorena producens]|uniref:hypothetical protein n=1 Tax=Moorena producens TaxID=1155739 RepID=UPI0011EA6E3F|nr:hypothetical protein [Moorena producens]